MGSVPDAAPNEAGKRRAIKDIVTHRQLEVNPKAYADCGWNHEGHEEHEEKEHGREAFQ